MLVAAKVGFVFQLGGSCHYLNLYTCIYIISTWTLSKISAEAAEMNAFEMFDLIVDVH
jgi:hypothetical protein